jgi:hypothetical protein
MSQSIDRAKFITLTLGGAGALLFGCASEDPGGGTIPAGGGAPGGAGAPGASGATGTAGGASGGTGGGGGGTTAQGGTNAGGTNTGGNPTGGTNNGGAGGDAAGGMNNGGAGGMTQSSCEANIVAEISQNHDHALEVPIADIMAGMPMVYDIEGDAGHSHFVEITAADFTVLQNGGTIKKVSCSGGDHEIVLSCGVADQTAGNPMCEEANTCGNAMGNLCPDPV